MTKFSTLICIALLTISVHAQTLLVQHLNGTVYFHNDTGSWQVLQLGQELNPNVHLQSKDGTAVIIWVDNTRVTIPPSTEITLKDPASKTIELQDGHILAENQGKRLSILTGYGGVGCDTGKYIISATSGVRSYAGTATVAVREVNGKFHVYNITDNDIVKVAAAGSITTPSTMQSPPYNSVEKPTAISDKAFALVTTPAPKLRDLNPPKKHDQMETESDRYQQYRLEKQNLDTDDRFKLSFREGFNMSAKFSGLGGSYNPNNAGSYGKNSPYDNGYIGTDSSGNAGGQTWNWGYANANGQVNPANNNIGMDRATGTSQDSSQNITMPGFELEYGHDFLVRPNYHIGIEGAVNFAMADIEQSSRFTSHVTTNETEYSYTPGTIPPGYIPPGYIPPGYNGTQTIAPYNGSYNGPGFLISSSPSGSAIVGSNSVPVEQHDSTKVYIAGVRIGPSILYSIGQLHQVELHLSGGLALAWVHCDEKWTQSINQAPSTTGGGSDDEILPGAYISTAADYRFADHWAVSGGLQWEDLGTYSHNFQGHTVSLDLTKSLYLTLGLNYNW